MRFLGLLGGVVILLYGLYWGFEHHIIAWAVTIKGFTLGLFKRLGTRAFWEHVPFVMGKWGMKSVTKVLLVHIPKTIIVAFAMVLIGPATRRWIRVQLWYVTHRLSRYFRRFRRRCDEYFGMHGLVAFFVSLGAAVIILVLSTALIGFELFFWFGKWGPIGTLFTWLSNLMTRFFYGMLHNVPFLGRIFGWFGNIWVSVIAPRYPAVAARHRQFVRAVLRKARRYRLITTDAHERFKKQRKQKMSR